jgi:hypothetical protein
MSQLEEDRKRESGKAEPENTLYYSDLCMHPVKEEEVESSRVWSLND